ncbi:MAG: XrtA system polysaccharide deacetylase [Syntrophorhabdales bacterium]|jgi:polysaccharide deacetylase family protein (PEP-CTERM system associated)
MMQSQGLNILSVDLEDWFHILDLHKSQPAPSAWDSFPSRLELITDRILELLSEQNVCATFFVLGWIAEKYPAIVKKIDFFGHEVACHGHEHALIYHQTPEQFRKDIRRAKRLLQDMTGKSVTGYRGPGFSITRDNLWAFDIIAEEGFSYDATLYPGKHAHGGIPGLPSTPFCLVTRSGHRIEEFPATILALGGRRTAFSGGGYFRLCPLVIMTRLIAAFNRKGAPVMMYLHPRDLDSQTPRLPMSLKRRFKCYVNVSRSFNKLRLVLERHAFGSIRDWPNRQKEKMPTISLSDFVPRERIELLAG